VGRSAIYLKDFDDFPVQLVRDDPLPAISMPVSHICSGYRGAEPYGFEWDLSIGREVPGGGGPCRRHGLERRDPPKGEG